MYSFSSKVRYSEIDRNGKMKIESLIDYFQDCSTFQSEQLGLGVNYLKENNRAWVLSAWQIIVDKYPELCCDIEIGTFPYDFKGFLGYRNFFMRDIDGTQYARANSLWTLIDTEKMHPAKPCAEMVDKYTLEEKMVMDYSPRKIVIAENGIEQEKLVVRGQHLDSNQHVNNGQYVRIALEYLPEDFEVKHLRVEYRRQFVLGDTIIPMLHKCENGYVVALCNEVKEPYAVIEFKEVLGRCY